MKTLFTNDRFFLTVTLCSAICLAAFSVIGIIVVPEMIITYLISIAIVSCVISIYVSYKKHKKNAMKGMMGALLMAILISALNTMNQTIDVFSIVWSLGTIAMTIALYVMHFVINESRKAKPAHVFVNQILCVLLSALGLSYNIYLATCFSYLPMTLLTLFGGIGFAAVGAVVVCVESRLDAYRLNREAAGWTEETGYPEGYVHEYEKK